MSSNQNWYLIFPVYSLSAKYFVWYTFTNFGLFIDFLWILCHLFEAILSWRLIFPNRCYIVVSIIEPTKNQCKYLYKYFWWYNKTRGQEGIWFHVLTMMVKRGFKLRLLKIVFSFFLLWIIFVYMFEPLLFLKSKMYIYFCMKNVQ